MPKVPYPNGNGHPDCPLCKGRGGTDEPQPVGPPAFVPCRCTFITERNAKLENVWKGLSRVKRLETSPLTKYPATNLWVHGPIEVFKRHLRYVISENPMKWFVRLETDASVVGAWLSNLAVKGQEIYDLDAMEESTRYFAIQDLALPPDLLIFRVGVKHTPNKDAHSAFHEALAERDHEGKPTWIVDSPSEPWDPDLVSYSESLNELFCSWPKITLKDDSAPPKPNIRLPQGGYHMLSLADEGSGEDETGPPKVRVPGSRKKAKKDPLAELQARERESKPYKKKGGPKR